MAPVIHGLLLLWFSNYAIAYNILFLVSYCSKSHVIGMLPVAEELGRRGHQVTLMTPYVMPSSAPGLTLVHLSHTDQYIRDHETNFFEMDSTDIAFLYQLLDRVVSACNVTYLEPQVQDLLTNPTTLVIISNGSRTESRRYDVVVIDGIMNECMLPIAHRLDVPAILLNPVALYAVHAWSMNIPHPYSYIPTMVRPFAGQFTFYQRTMVLLTNLVFMVARWLMFLQPCDQLIRDNFIPDSPTLNQLENRVSLYIANSHFSFQPSIPSMPYFVEAGCLHCRPANKLPPDIEDYLNSAGEDGTIYVSFGSIAKGDYIPRELLKKFIEGFAQIPQKILWKMDIDIPDLPRNVRLIKWAPQQDIIAHPQVKLFISHGGGLSTFEAAYHGCPLIGFPLGSDQNSIMAIAADRGFAKPLDWRSFTTDELVQTMKELLTDESFKARALEVSKLLKDRPQPPVETAAFWVEYVIRHQGAPHLKSGAEHLNFFQYFLLDVIGLLLVCVLALITIIYFVVKMCINLIKDVRALKAKAD